MPRFEINRALYLISFAIINHSQCFDPSRFYKDGFTQISFNNIRWQRSVGHSGGHQHLSRPRVRRSSFLLPCQPGLPDQGAAASSAVTTSDAGDAVTVCNFIYAIFTTYTNTSNRFRFLFTRYWNSINMSSKRKLKFVDDEHLQHHSASSSPGGAPSTASNASSSSDQGDNMRYLEIKTFLLDG